MKTMFRAMLAGLFLVIFIAGCLPEQLESSPTIESGSSEPAPLSTAEPTTMPATPTVTPAAVEPWWNDTVFYEVFVRSFNDSNGDGVGDIQGLIQKLDYLNDGDPATTDDLGVTGLWLMPITQSPSYHGYDVTDYYQVDFEYGTNEDFKQLMEETHKRGIKIIIDLVLNHTSAQHPWFVESVKGNPEYADWYIWEDQDPGFTGPWGQKVWIKARNDRYYYAVFWDQMPDLNLENPAVTAEIQNISRFWVEEMGVDGFRLDAIRHFVEDGAAQENTPATHEWLQEYYRFYKSLDPALFTVGEAWTLTPLVLDYVGDEVDIAFEFYLAEAFITAAKGPLAVALTKQMQIVLDSYPEGQYGVFLTNHDQNRIMSQLNDDEVRAKLAATMMLTAPGVPFIYYGEEIGMTGFKPDEDLRRPMQWTSDSLRVGFTTGFPWRSPAGDYGERSVALQDNDPQSLLNHYRSLIHLRNEYPALRTGEAVLVDAGSPRLYAMLRYTAEQAFLILVNVHPKPLSGDNYSLSLPSGPFSAGVQAEGVFGLPDPAAPVINASGGFDAYVPFAEIPAQSSMIIKLTP